MKEKKNNNNNSNNRSNITRSSGFAAVDFRGFMFRNSATHFHRAYPSLPSASTELCWKLSNCARFRINTIYKTIIKLFDSVCETATWSGDGSGERNFFSMKIQLYGDPVKTVQLRVTNKWKHGSFISLQSNTNTTKKTSSIHSEQSTAEHHIKSNARAPLNASAKAFCRYTKNRFGKTWARQ